METMAISVTLAFLLLFLLCLIGSIILIGICTSRQRMAEFRAEMERRRNAIRQQYLEEQREWRQRRLQSVVLLLIQRGEVMEGIPLAAQIPGHREVLCRRKIRQARARQRLADEILDEVREEEERSVFSSPIRQTIYKTLNELLANGRPAEAEAGPDIMQMLLDGQEPHQLSPSDWDNDNNDDDDDDTNSEYWIDVTQQNTRNTSLITSPLQPESLSQSHEQEESPHLSSHPLHTSDNNNMSSNTNNNITNINHTEQQEQQQQEVQSEHHDSNSNNNNNNNNSIVVPDITNNMTEAEARHARWLEERRAAIVRELHAEQARKQRRRRTAEEVYGVGVPYLGQSINVLCNIYVKDDKSGSIIAINESNEEEPQSPFMRFLSPLSPFRNRNRRRAESTFEVSSPAASNVLFSPTNLEEGEDNVRFTREFSSPAATEKQL